MRKLSYFIACSIDGFIGDPSGEADFFTRFADEEYMTWFWDEYPEALPTHVRRALGIDDRENKKFDTVIQGRSSYDVALKDGITSPYAHMREYVASRTLKESPDPNVEIVSDDVVGRIRELKQEGSEFGIYLCGGSKIAGELIDEVDELVIKTYPLVLGSGMPMFGSGFALTEFTLDDVRAFKNGVLVRTYTRKR
ncbi:dihydrofolate reductase [Streptomyces sp. HC44]|uniref:Dihydrofolate reductase n=1 Tax=Streptomyces scabichelini TaxID=2711217 RepID=A0A6G4VJ22_9ACTN|nr:dihydrofolate reductase family protein [Streptomyces scabichelini]NGO14158.1 dihydrofolate reductase [Streptomyces scabichelini]